MGLGEPTSTLLFTKANIFAKFPLTGLRKVLSIRANVFAIA